MKENIMGYYKAENISMIEKIRTGEAIDISGCEREGRFYIIPEEMWQDDMDYCDPTSGWVWSVGRRYSDGKILASLDATLYKSRDYECIWLR